MAVLASGDAESSDRSARGGARSSVSPMPWLCLPPGPWGLNACSRHQPWRFSRQGAYPVLFAHTVLPPPRLSLSSFHLFQAIVNFWISWFRFEV